MKLEVGRWYKNRIGKYVHIVASNNDCFMDDTGTYYSNDGRYGSSDCDFDLVIPMNFENECTPLQESANALLDEIERHKSNPVEPQHYKQYSVECIEVAEHKSFCIGSAIKYLWRAGEKDDIIVDLEKAKWYIEREIKRLKEQYA
jgi:hypothetical protein